MTFLMKINRYKQTEIRKFHTKEAAETYLDNLQKDSRQTGSKTSIISIDACRAIVQIDDSTYILFETNKFLMQTPAEKGLIETEIIQSKDKSSILTKCIANIT